MKTIFIKTVDKKKYTVERGKIYEDYYYFVICWETSKSGYWIPVEVINLFINREKAIEFLLHIIKKVEK